MTAATRRPAGNRHARPGVTRFMQRRLPLALAGLVALGSAAHAAPKADPAPRPTAAPSPVRPAAPSAPAARAAAPRDARAGRMVVDKVVAVVNDAVILRSEMLRRVAPLTADVQNITDRIERQRRLAKLEGDVLEEMVSEELIVQAAADAKLEVTAKEVDSALGEIKKQNNLDDNQLAQALRLQGYSMASYRQDVRKQIVRMRAVNMLVRPRVTVTDDDVRARYDAMSRRSAAVKRVKLRHLLIALSDKPNEAELAAAKKKAAELIEQIRGGADFARLAADHSDDESTKFTGGDLGWIDRNSLDTEWEVIVFAMAQGEVRGPITGPRGLHVFQATEVERNEQKAFDQVKEQIRAELFRREMDKQTQQWLTELRDKAHIELKL
jgi:peptidyl-prolyl cis-trans isomerase SurA